MSTLLFARDGGNHTEAGLNRIIFNLFKNPGVISPLSLKVSAADTPDNTVKIGTGDCVIGNTSSGFNYLYTAWVTAAESVVISANSSGNPRVDAVVAYIDKTVVDATVDDNPGALKFKAVEGTPASSPVAPTSSVIQTSVGASNPYILLATVAVANNFSSITNSNITDKRDLALSGKMVGELLIWPSTALPAGFLWCDGSSYLRSDYPELFGILGTSFGAADGSHFNVPDINKGRSIVGLDTSQTEFNTLGKTGGEKTHILSTGEMPYHTHPFIGQLFTGGAPNPPTNVYVGAVLGQTGVGSPTGQFGFDYVGNNDPHNNMPPYISFPYIIKY